MVAMSHYSPRSSDDPALDAGELLVRIGVAVLAIAVPVSMALSRRALFGLIPVGAVILLLGGSLLPHGDLRRKLTSQLGSLSLSGMSGIALFGWCILSLLWTPFPVDAALHLFKLGGLFALVAVTVALMPGRTKTANLNLFPIGLVATAAASVAAIYWLSPDTFLTEQPENSTTERAAISLVVLMWPAIGALAVRDRWRSASFVAVGVMVAAISAWTSIALAALAIGAMTFTAASFHPARVARVLGVVAALLLLFAPALPFVIQGPAAALTDRLGDRIGALADISGSLQNWSSIVRSEAPRLITGHGFDITTRAVASGFVPAPAPHSLLFEIWYELGLVGAVSAALFVAGAFYLVGRATSTVAPFLVAELAAAATIMLWGSETTQLWWVNFLVVAAVAFVQVERGQYRTERPQIDALQVKSAM